MLIPVDIMWIKLLEFVNICTGIGSLKINSNCLRIATATARESAKAIASADNTKRTTSRDLYDLEETDIEMWL